ncbi:immunoglobulin-like domain-containing protein, partial [Paenibacillus paridis]|uniref:immunoglobulin-like domain-containing protein n=1 Tax=Paenibacillus paridis TaxID=2583376 RepID=UPI0030828189
LTLPATGANGTTITWSSNDSTVVDEDGKVTRPSYTAGDKEVTLIATITKGGVTETKTFTVQVKANPQTNAEAVAEDKAALEVTFESGDSATNVTKDLTDKAALEVTFESGDSATNVTKDLTLPATGASGTTISWSSSDTTVVDEDGKVTRPSYTAGDKEVTLTATITKGGVTETKTFTVQV